MVHDSILVTGSSGTIGTALSEALLGEGYDIICADNRPNRWSETIDERTLNVDLANEDATDSLPESVDLIIHLAANARVRRLVKNPDFAKENFDSTYNVLEYARRINADVIFASSREVYGNRDTLIFEESDTQIDVSENPYTASKIGGEALIKSYENCYGVDASIVRFSNIYGTYDASNRVIPLFIAQVSDGEDLVVYGKGKVLDFTYIDDCISGILKVVSKFHKASGSTFNIASGQGTSIVELAEMIVDQMDANVSIQTESNRTGEVRRFVADISKARQVLGYEPEYDIAMGIEKTVDWYCSRQELFDEIRC